MISSHFSSRKQRRRKMTSSIHQVVHGFKYISAQIALPRLQCCKCCCLCLKPTTPDGPCVFMAFLVLKRTNIDSTVFPSSISLNHQFFPYNKVFSLIIKDVLIQCSIGSSFDLFSSHPLFLCFL